MWLLTHEGSLTEEKRLWLRPGTSHLLGRGNHATDFRIFVDAKSVSRKHLVIEVRPGSSSSPSEIVLRDSSKFGTHLDGEKFVEAEKVVRPEVGKVRWEIRLGNWAVAWRLEWHPVTVTMSGGAKKKAKAAVGATLESRLEALDIKIVRDYVPTRVTHVVAAKRNTPKGLQALVEGKHVVSEAFVDALEKVTAKCEVVVDAEGKEKLPRAPLEEDFDGNWPDEMDYVPDPSNESVERPVELYAPSSERASVFAGYTFIFCDEAQFDQLAPVVTLGNGKALLRELETGSDDVESFVRYAKDVAGEKGLGEFEDGSEGKGVVVVRISQPRGQDEEWYVRFYRDIDLELGQRSINQNEFLDAIVINDASALRQPLQPAAEDDVPPSSIPGPPPSTSGMLLIIPPVVSANETQWRRPNSLFLREKRREPNQCRLLRRQKKLRHRHNHQCRTLRAVGSVARLRFPDSRDLTTLTPVKYPRRSAFPMTTKLRTPQQARRNPLKHLWRTHRLTRELPEARKGSMKIKRLLKYQTMRGTNVPWTSSSLLQLL